MKGLIFACKLASRNLARNYKKNLIALFSIVAGFISVNLFEGYVQNAQEIFNTTYERRFFYGDLMIHHHKAFQDSLFFDGVNYIAKKDHDLVIEKLSQSKDIHSLVRRLNIQGSISNGSLYTSFFGEGVDINDAKKMRSPTWGWNVSAGKLIEQNSRSAILGEELGRLLNCKIKDNEPFLNPNGGYIAKERKLDCPKSQLQISTTTRHGQMNALFVEAVGVSNTLFREFDSRYIQVPLEVAQNLMDTDEISFFTLRLNDDVDKLAFQNEFNHFLESNQLPLRIVSWKDNAFGTIYKQSMSFLNVLRGFFLIVILCIVLFSISATQIRLIFERISEIATLRSLGFSNLIIKKIILAEAVFLATIGSILGSLLSLVISYTFKKIGIFYLIGILSEEVPFNINVSLNTICYSFGCLIIITILATYIPLRRALKLTISEAFSHS